MGKSNSLIFSFVILIGIIQISEIRGLLEHLCNIDPPKIFSGSQLNYNCTPVDGSCALFYQNASATFQNLISSNLNADNSSDIKLNTPDLLNKYGYATTTVQVTTDDGFILTMFRITKGRNYTGPIKGVVILQHGLLCSSDDWLAQDVGRALPHMLADAGYEVWLGNNRGNRYSMAHVSLSSSSPVFWKWTFHEMGKFDVPAMINVVLTMSGFPNLYWIGHSQGTLQYFVAASLYPDIQDKVKAFYALSPIVYVQHVQGVARVLAQLSDLSSIAELATDGEFNLNTAQLGLVTQNCGISFIAQAACSSVFYALGGFDFCNTYCDKVAQVVQHTPTSVSTRTMFHYFQMVNSGKFRQFDTRCLSLAPCLISLGTEPLNYTLSNFRTPSIFFSGGRDWLGTPKDIDRLVQELGAYNNSNVKRIDTPMYNHLDFTYAINAWSIIYARVLNSIQSGTIDIS